MTRPLRETNTGMGARPWLVVLMAASPALLLAAWTVPQPWLAPFLGRFHPVVLHFPIASLLLAAWFEIMAVVSGGRIRSAPSRLVFIGAFSAVLSAALGVLLREADGVGGELAENHQFGGIVVSALAVIAVFFRYTRGFRREPVWRWSYRITLLVCSPVIMLTAHFGAGLTHGEDYLLEFAPWRGGGGSKETARAVSFPQDKPVAEWQAYEHVVAPILVARCSNCHDERNNKGKLILDTWEGLIAGGKNGEVLVPGNPERSPLIARLLLPLDHKEHMPPRKKPQPAPEELAALRFWVAAGAAREGALAGLGAGEEIRKSVAALPAILAAIPADTPDDEGPDEEEIRRARAAHAPAVARLQAKFPGLLSYESRESADLHFNAATLGSRFGDEDLADFAEVMSEIVWMDLSGTAVTDQSSDVLGQMTKLRTVRLARTAVGDETVSALAQLPDVESLSLVETRVTARSGGVVAGMTSLRRKYFEGTPLSLQP